MCTLGAGLVHYQQNLDCFDATYIISYNHEDPGTQVEPKLGTIQQLAVVIKQLVSPFLQLLS